MLNIIKSAEEITNAINTDNVLVCIVFTAPWCSNCKMSIPQIEKAQDKLNNPNINIYKLELSNENMEIADNYKVSNLPTTIFFKNREECSRITGTISANRFISTVESIILNN